MNQGTSQDIATFRDPAGSLRIHGEQVVRTVHPRYATESLRFLESDLARRWTTEGHLVATEVVSSVQDEALVLEHPRVFFPSYPWEWTPGQWVAAAELTLEFCRQLLHQGWILKDATPLNILFDGSRPVFVDLLSVERRDPGNPLWLAYGQFARTFLLPLAAYKYLGWPLAATLNRRDGYEPADLYPYLSSFQRWSAPLRTLVTLPFLLETRKRGSRPPRKLKQEPEIATAVLERNLRRPKKALGALAVKERTRAGASTRLPPIITASWSGSASRNLLTGPCKCFAPARCSISAATPGNTHASLRARAHAWSPGIPMLPLRIAVGGRRGRLTSRYFPWLQMWPALPRQSAGAMPNRSLYWNAPISGLTAS